MKSRTVCMSAVIVALGMGMVARADTPAPQPTQASGEAAERAKFVGFWKGSCGPIQLELTITEKTIHGIQITKDGKVDHGVGEFTLNLAANPRHMDASQTNERGRKTTYTGIYTLEGDTLKWCLCRGDTRPDAFEEKKGVFLVNVKKQSGSAPPRSK